ncbi:MAG: C40 family peptidase [Flavobacteriales bacterium]|nr:C40 family peptidase [Flavobacteriales bacterium]
MSESGICIYNTLPCREDPSHKSQMNTQLLFGETYQVLDRHDDWLLIESDHDHYSSWITAIQHHPFENDITDLLSISDTPVAFIEHQYLSVKQLLPLFVGSKLPDRRDKIWYTGMHTFTYPDIKKRANTLSPEEVHRLSSMYLHSPYLWGGRSPAGIDCSGLVQVVMGLMNIKLPRDAYQQANEGKLVDFIHEAQAGDLAFFDNADGHIIHVGIMLNHEHIIHASGTVRIDRIDHAGIFHSELQKYTHRLRIIKRIA